VRELQQKFLDVGHLVLESMELVHDSLSIDVLEAAKIALGLRAKGVRIGHFGFELLWVVVWIILDCQKVIQFFTQFVCFFVCFWC